MAASQSLSRLKAKRYRKRVNNPLPAIQALLKALDAVSIDRNWPADLKSQYRTVLKNVRRRADHVARLDARRCSRVTRLNTRIQQGARLAHTRDLNEVLAWLLNRQAHRSKGLYAMAMGKKTAAKLGRDHYKAIGRKGAQTRWNPEIAQYLAMWSVGTLFPD